MVFFEYEFIMDSSGKPIKLRVLVRYFAIPVPWNISINFP